MTVRNLTANRVEGAHFFFGYYDLQPYSPAMRLHLCHKVSFMDHHPTADEPAEIGYIETESGIDHRITETHARSFRQGAFLQWFEPGQTVVFNDFDGEKYVSRAVTLDGMEVQRYDRPFAPLHRESGRALSINFSIDIRCDLHARRSPDGSRITYDTTESGCCAIMEIQL